MGKDKLSDKEAALIAAARRELQAKAQAPAQTPAQIQVQTRTHPNASAPAVKPSTPPQTSVPGGAAIKPQPSAAERMAALMEAEREENERRKKQIRRYGVVLPTAILAAAVLWVLMALRRR